MEILSISPNILKIKGKKSSLLLIGKDSIKTKVEAHMILSLKKSLEVDLSKVEGVMFVVQGPGDYEVSEVKVSAFSDLDNLAYIVNIDNANILVSSFEMLKNSKNLQDEYDIAILQINSEFDESLLASLSSKVLVLFGDNKAAALKQLGKETLSPVSKYQIKTDKLPGETEVVSLQ